MHGVFAEDTEDDMFQTFRYGRRKGELDFLNIVDIPGSKAGTVEIQLAEGKQFEVMLVIHKTGIMQKGCIVFG
jgi:hypothetical protein